MKLFVATITLLLAAITLGCKDAKTPKSEARVETASEAARNDNQAIAVRLAQQKAAVDEAFARERAREEARRKAEALQAIGTRWTDGLNEAGRTPRSEISGIVKKLQVIKNEAETFETGDCTAGARATLVSSMAASIEALNLFQKETGSAGEASTLKLQLGADLLFAAQRETSACLVK